MNYFCLKNSYVRNKSGSPIKLYKEMGVTFLEYDSFLLCMYSKTSYPPLFQFIFSSFLRDGGLLSK